MLCCKTRAERHFRHYMAQIAGNFPLKTAHGTKFPWDGTADPWDGNQNPWDGSAGTPRRAAFPTLKGGRTWPSALTVCHIAHSASHAERCPPRLGTTPRSQRPPWGRQPRCLHTETSPAGDVILSRRTYAPKVQLSPLYPPRGRRQASGIAAACTRCRGVSPPALRLPRAKNGVPLPVGMENDVLRIEALATGYGRGRRRRVVSAGLTGVLPRVVPK